MARPKRLRTITHPPLVSGFKPMGGCVTGQEVVTLLFEEYEALRLADYQGMTQEQAAVEMGVSRPTFTRVYEKARCAVARSLVEGRVLLIEGGCYQTRPCCPQRDDVLLEHGCCQGACSCGSKAAK
ncbi:putative DNA-binding protein (UPF0251 family) [Breznakibacter xylanolyticus]|uniref:UPF0251 protein LX69_01717 n=1 Tax=Breznakibacter xylanolyticus TaxID=990 RepID=A0A2W7P0C4_9BACT|nr:DUF134 domain-containing protein [Breznakibacter xylanolyticus]PZX16902.1 putative DNA-binding protein (UPF0251 family) [Breznakibacter xylanolyticus]